MYLELETEGYLKALVIVAQKECEDIKESYPNLSIHAIKLFLNYFDDMLLKGNNDEGTRFGT